MREIKFRCWFPDLNQMIQPSAELTEDGVWRYFEASKNVKAVVMQYTGIKDKNGVEIYEGDIVTGDNDGTLDTVIFTSGCFCLKDAMQHYEATYWGDEVEVIGNIYENKELLK